MLDEARGRIALQQYLNERLGHEPSWRFQPAITVNLGGNIDPGVVQEIIKKTRRVPRSFRHASIMLLPEGWTLYELGIRRSTLTAIIRAGMDIHTTGPVYMSLQDLFDTNKYRISALVDVLRELWSNFVDGG